MFEELKNMMWTRYEEIRTAYILISLRWRHNVRDSVSNHQPRDCLLNRLFRRRSKKTSKLRVTGLCVGNSPGTGEFPTQMDSNAENVSIWWRHHVVLSMISRDWHKPNLRDNKSTNCTLLVGSDSFVKPKTSHWYPCLKKRIIILAHGVKSLDLSELTHLPLVPHLCVSESV